MTELETVKKDRDYFKAKLILTNKHSDFIVSRLLPLSFVLGTLTGYWLKGALK